jgi:hypothetical protein
MAAKSITSYRSSVTGGAFREVYGTITAMANNDTVTLNAFKKIVGIEFASPTTNASYGFTISGNVATLVSGGNITGLIHAVGY